MPTLPPASSIMRRSIMLKLLAALVGLAPQFLEPSVAAAIVAVEPVADRILQIVILVIFFSLVERAGRNDFSLDRLLETRLHGLLRRFGQPTLLLVTIKDRGAVLVPVVAELRIPGERIVVAPEPVEQFFVRRFCRIVEDLDGFRVSGTARRHLLVGGIGHLAPGITGRRGDDARHLVEIGF